jgi:hypothetical protein
MKFDPGRHVATHESRHRVSLLLPVGSLTGPAGTRALSHSPRLSEESAGPCQP